MSVRMVTVLNPQYGRTPGGRILQPHERPALALKDFVTVPVLATYGVWSVSDILPKVNDDGYPGATLSELANYANKLEQEGWR